MSGLRSLLCIMLFTLCLGQTFGQYTQEDWDERDKWMDVQTIFELAGIEGGDQVADVGCHEGYLTFHLSKKVGKTGRIYAVDILSYRLENLREHLKQEKIKNVTVIQGEEDDPKLPENRLDAVIIMDTYHEMENYTEVLFHIKKALKPSGRILVLEKLKTHKKGKSREEQTNAHTLSPKYVKKELEEAGFSIRKEIGDFGDWKEDKDKPMWILVGVSGAL
ncbi:class I SAM-dependent methyltransferase [Ulvibacterium marinum]|uniref:Methyltransferase domain-containing protein n=1 Tax=Ulvibacterium marinum TaxID=2419782 RepID=A0A3B0CDU5_9FLAO|nr:methyltransferase domain-containing protein [Ulvibacterium marinum]RKN81116.1 methyltransferase domain-containing protein [Ulvibacterium marinum]